MKVQQIANASELRPLKLSSRETPHLTLEPNTTCNVSCARCYNLYRGTVKPLAQIEAEIDQGLRLRNLETISIVGGEPTLHPQIDRVVAAVKRRGLVCELLTNGVRLQERGGDELLERLLDAGIDRLILHIDSGQAHIHQDVDAARRALMDRLEARRVFHALAVTIYPGEEEEELPELMRRYAGYRYFDGVLATLAMHPEEAAVRTREDGPTMAGVYRGISQRLGVEPATYLPASNDDDTVTWLLFFYYLNVETGETLDVSPPLSRLFRRLMRRIYGRHFFAPTLPPALFLPTLGLTGLAELVVHPRKLSRLRGLLRRADLGRALRLHYIVVQQAPSLDGSGEVGICYHCPDATIRNGKLTPVCLADRINPLVEGAPVDESLRRMVFAHLNEG